MDFKKIKPNKIKNIFLLILAISGIVFLTNQQVSPHVSYSFPIPTATPVSYQVYITQTREAVVTATATVLATAQQSVERNDFIPPQKDFYLYIPKLNLKAPVFSNVSGTDKEAYLKVLENGVAHYAGTSMPGEPGRVFIFGHSSYFANLPGNYKKIFAPLNNLTSGDEIKVYFQGKNYLYKVKDKIIVSPDDMSILNPTDTKTLSLQTCWPPGTTQKRLVVNSEQVDF